MTPLPDEGSRSAAILRSVHARPGATRASLVRTLGISSGLATDTVGRLTQAALLAEIPAPATGARGRPTHAVVAHPAGPLVAAVAISDERWELALIELGGGIVSHFTTRHGGDWPDVRRSVRRRLAAAELAAGGRIAAVCASAPGTVSGLRVVQAPNLGWEDIDLGQLVPRAGLARLRSVQAGNDASLAGLGEARRGSSAGARTVIHLHMDNGIGGALLLDGRPVAGAQGLAGEFGHMPFGPRGRRCRCGASGCWNTGLDAAALASGLGVTLPTDEVSFTVRVLERASEGGASERRAVRRAARILGEGTAALVNALDPELVCFGGLAPALRAAAPEPLQAGYRRGLMSSRARHPRRSSTGAWGPGPCSSGRGSLALTCSWAIRRSSTGRRRWPDLRAVPGDMAQVRVGDPGFEPGTSSLSEKRSNRLS